MREVMLLAHLSQTAAAALIYILRISATMVSMFIHPDGF